ncbi:MAG: TetR/AcrR family transcriptional regulator [Agathobacter sp.]|nr:TetR/AcrR family transcriptional regulator [Agathobacter sp.]
MPPKAKYTREEIIEIAFQMARENGIDSVVARELGKKLGTSSSPIFTAFKNMEELQLEIRDRAMQEFESYVSDALNYTPAFKYVGVRMIQFAMQEPKLFQILYMKEHEESQKFDDLVNELGETVEVCLDVMQQDYALKRAEAELLFRQVWLHTFGICVLAANKVCHFKPEEISQMLSIEFQGTLTLIKSGRFQDVEVKTKSEE